MKLDLFDYLNFFIFLLGIMAFLRWKAVDRLFIPFLWFILVGCCNEALSYALVAKGYETILNNNIYLLFESLLLLWFFYNIGVFKRNGMRFVSLTSFIFLSVWLTQLAVYGIRHRYFIYFTLTYALAVVLMSIAIINKLLISHRGPVLKNSLFLICIGFTSYYTLNILVKAFWLYGVGKSNDFLLNVHYIMLIVNFITNVIYAISILLMPRRPLPLFIVDSRLNDGD